MSVWVLRVTVYQRGSDIISGYSRLEDFVLVCRVDRACGTKPGVLESVGGDIVVVVWNWFSR
jgi:hypothetical protein